MIRHDEDYGQHDRISTEDLVAPEGSAGRDGADRERVADGADRASVASEQTDGVSSGSLGQENAPSGTAAQDTVHSEHAGSNVGTEGDNRGGVPGADRGAVSVSADGAAVDNTRAAGDNTRADLADAQNSSADAENSRVANGSPNRPNGSPNHRATPEEDHAELIEGSDSDRFRSRWHEVQAAFVDDPQRAVQDADQLVAELMQTLAATFAERKQSLEGQWRDGGDAETEDLRLALRSYRSFFDQLLPH